MFFPSVIFAITAVAFALANNQVDRLNNIDELNGQSVPHYQNLEHDSLPEECKIIFYYIFQ